MKLHKRTTSTILALPLALATTALGQIGVTLGGSGQSGNSSFNFTYDASSQDKLVVIVAGEHGTPSNLSGDVTSVTYDNAGLTEIINRDPIAAVDSSFSFDDQTFHSIFYMDNPSTSAGLLEFSITGGSRATFTVLGLTGTAAGFGNTAISGQNSSSVDLTTTSGDSLVIASYALGGASNIGNNQNNINTVLPLVEVDAEGGRFNGHVVGRQTVASASSNTFAFDSTSNDGHHVIAAEFTAVPEPSSALLAGMSCLTWVMLRRRS